ncbi:MAG: nicotinate (nicotinamide) nucleotide adenylyltransferase [Planctomycetes bacterium]|jgi:nicotinate-nucleotide adenylyltransferase|nr:nicotinate (nicotinamide) nucleotide adenylyltransferase [Planctomycetota bacterium]
MVTRRIALFGGTFDPIHRGHATVARAAAREIGAERLIFIPARVSPLKGFFPFARDEDRLRMIELALAGQETLGVSDCELKRPAPSFTLDTVRQFQRDYGPETAIHWLLGADSVGDLVHWHRIEELIDACHLTTMRRPGYEPDFDRFVSRWGPQRIARLQQDAIVTPLVDISSTEVRRRLAAGENVSDLLHPEVLRYIREHHLYQAPQP